jgi:predicted lipid-binding transport protein (Tim44 family)
MKRFSILTLIVLAATTLIAADMADARRMGSGRSFGAQRQATPTAPTSPGVAPASPAAPASSAMAAKAGAPAAAGAASGASRWLGPIAGIAAGLGLAALLSHFGLPEGLGSFLLIALLVVGGIFIVRALLARRAQPAMRQPVQFAGAGAGAGSTAGGFQPQSTPANAGPSSRLEPVLSNNWSQPAAAATAAQFPPGFNAAGFAEQAKQQFRRLQAAYDSNDRRALAEVMTPGMYAEIGKEIDERGRHTATEIDNLNAEVLSVATEGDRHWASVQFKGSLREDGAVLPKEFEEVWNLSKPVDGSSGWLLAGIQQLNAA